MVECGNFEYDSLSCVNRLKLWGLRVYSRVYITGRDILFGKFGVDQSSSREDIPCGRYSMTAHARLRCTCETENEFGVGFDACSYIRDWFNTPLQSRVDSPTCST